MDALLIVIIVAAATSLVCWVLSLITRDTSWVDRAWSIVPVAYVWIFVGVSFAEGDGSARLVAMGLLATAWGARLTFNFARKGGYTGMEDYRWAILRARMAPWQFQVFNLLFIVLYQNALLVLGSATPSVETYYGAKQGKYPVFRLSERFLGAGLPDVLGDSTQLLVVQRI